MITMMILCLIAIQCENDYIMQLFMNIFGGIDYIMHVFWYVFTDDACIYLCILFTISVLGDMFCAEWYVLDMRHINIDVDIFFKDLWFFQIFLSFLCDIFRVSPETDPRRRDQCVLVHAEPAVETATLNHDVHAHAS